MSGDTVTGESLQFTDDNKYAYAQGGLIDSSTSEVTQLKFTTHEPYIIATIMFNGGVDPANITNGIYKIFYILINSKKIAAIKVESNLEDMPSTYLYEILIPSYSDFEITADSTFTGYKTSVSLTGKVGMAPRVGNLVE